MKRAALGALLTCTSMACAASQTTIPQPGAATSSVADGTRQLGVEGQDESHGEEIAASTHDNRATVIADKPWLNAAGGSEFVRVDGADQFVGVWVEVPEGIERAHVPMALTLTIDTSGSMGGQKMVQARNAARALVQQMHQGDIVTIHTFSDGADELVRPTVLDHRSRELIINTLSELSADGATNMFEALNLAIGRARHAPSTHPVKRVVMISDGRATAGPTSTHTLANIAERGTQFGVQVTSLGVGLDYDEDTLNALAVRSSGRLYHLSDPTEMSSIVKSELDLLQSTMATNAVVEVVPAPGVQLIGANGVRSTWGSRRSLNVPLGTMFSGQRREILVRYRLITSEVEGTKPIVSARLHFHDVTDGNVPRVQEVVVRGKLTNDKSLVDRHANATVQEIIALNEASVIASQARAEVTSGNFDAADVRLARAEEKLRLQARNAKSKKDRLRMSRAADGVARNRRGVRKAAKAPPAAQASAKRGASLELNDFAMEAQGY